MDYVNGKGTVAISAGTKYVGDLRDERPKGEWAEGWAKLAI